MLATDNRRLTHMQCGRRRRQVVRSWAGTSYALGMTDGWLLCIEFPRPKQKLVRSRARFSICLARPINNWCICQVLAEAGTSGRILLGWIQLGVSSNRYQSQRQRAGYVDLISIGCVRNRILMLLPWACITAVYLIDIRSWKWARRITVDAKYAFAVGRIYSARAHHRRCVSNGEYLYMWLMFNDCMSGPRRKANSDWERIFEWARLFGAIYYRFLLDMYQRVCLSANAFVCFEDTQIAFDWHSISLKFAARPSWRKDLTTWMLVDLTSLA